MATFNLSVSTIGQTTPRAVAAPRIVVRAAALSPSGYDPGYDDGYAQGLLDADSTDAYNEGYADGIVAGAGLLFQLEAAAFVVTPVVAADADIVNHTRVALLRLPQQFKSGTVF